LRYLVRSASEAEGIVPLLPALHGALEETLTQPFAGLAHGGTSRKRAALAELTALLREVHTHCSKSNVPPSAAALSLAMLCVPLAREELEPLLGSLLSDLPQLVLDQKARYCCSHAAQLVLRVYICSAGRNAGSRTLISLLSQLAASLDALPATISELPLPANACTEPLEIDWDFGAFGRLCHRNLDTSRLAEELLQCSKTSVTQEAITAMVTEILSA